MMPIAGINFEWWLIIIIGVVGLLVQGRLQSVFAKYSRVPFPGGLTGREVAEKMLRENGIYDVTVTSTRGHLTDHYNPRNKTVNLSESVYNSNSVAAAAVACHECGHAVQHATGYAPLELRSQLVPIISITGFNCLLNDSLDKSIEIFKSRLRLIQVIAGNILQVRLCDGVCCLYRNINYLSVF